MKVGVLLLGITFGGCRDHTEHRAPAPAAKVSQTSPRVPRPRTPPSLPTTSIAWSIAEANNTAAAWDAAADAYEHALARCTDSCRDTAYRVVLARKSSLKADPIQPPPLATGPWHASPLPKRVQATVDALDHYVTMLDADDPDLPGMQFLAGSTLWRWQQPDALVRFEALLREHPTAEVAEYAANLLLDAMNRQGRFDEMLAMVARLRADPQITAGRPDLVVTLDRIAAHAKP